MNTRVGIASVVAGIAIATTATLAVEGTGGAPAYVAAKEVTIRGQVTAVHQHASWMGWDGVHVVLQTASGPVEVHVAPKPFLELMELAIEVGDNLEVTGAPAKADGGDVLLAREVRKKNVVIAVRDKSGTPVW